MWRPSPALVRNSLQYKRAIFCAWIGAGFRVGIRISYRSCKLFYWCEVRVYPFICALFLSSSYEVHEADGVSMRDEILLFSLLCSAVYRDSCLRFHLCRRSVPEPLSIFNPSVQMVLRCSAQNSEVKNWVRIWISYRIWIGVTSNSNVTYSSTKQMIS